MQIEGTLVKCDLKCVKVGNNTSEALQTRATIDGVFKWEIIQRIHKYNLKNGPLC